MKLEDNPVRLGSLTFECNLCGEINQSLMTDLGRELPSCRVCQSTVRMRHLGLVVAQCLFKESSSLSSLVLNDNLRGLGMTDPSQLAEPLMRKFNYVNSFYDGEPFFDITNPPSKFEGKFDFLISSEVFEHIPPPIDRAFINARKVLKKGGHFIFSVPFGIEKETIEHFPDLYDYKICQDDQGDYLMNTTQSGEVQIRRDLTFHPGRGNTLEMRFFSPRDVKRHLRNSGFDEITLWDQPYFPFGIYSSNWCGAPFSARAI